MARDRSPQLEEGLSALRLEASGLEETLAGLGRAPSPRELRLRSGCGDKEVGRIVREALLVNASLHRLTLDLRECSDDGATHLAELMEKTAGIKHLTLMLNNLTARGAQVLAAALPSSPLLSLTLYSTQMDLHDCCVGDEGAQHFATALPQCRHLTALGLTQSGVTPTGLGYLLRALEENPRVTSLNLHSNFIDDVGAADLSRFLSTTSHLKQLILNENHCIGDEGVRELALALSHNSTLEVLSLRSCGVSWRGAGRFAEPLIHNSTLRVLNLCGNAEIGDDGVEMIARGLRGNSGLQRLDLSSCGVSDEGCDHLAEALGTSSSTALTHLTLHKNSISDGGAISLAHSLTKNSCLAVLVLSGNPVGEKGVAALGRALEHNSSLTSLVLGQGGGEERGAMSPLGRSSSRNRGTKSLESKGTVPERGGTVSERGGGVPERGGGVPERGGGVPERGGGVPERGRTVPERGGTVSERGGGVSERGGGVPERGGRGGRRGKRVVLVPDGSPTLALVEALVSKNRRLAGYKKTIRELRERVRQLEQESRTSVVNFATVAHN